MAAHPLRQCVPFVNVYFVGDPQAADGSWVLVDAGLQFSTRRIRQAAEARFGRRPAAIILTHGHFDHVGAAAELARYWDVPIYAHELEMPYLTGRSAYPPADPSVGGGTLALLSSLYPRWGIDLGDRVQVLPSDGTVPGMPGWRWLHTPGHTTGHVSLFHDADGTLISGDAMVTVKQESALAVITQRQGVHRPPAYFTPDWQAARNSVESLAALRPRVLASGHGPPMRGERMANELKVLARDFNRIAVPARGRYVRQPAQADASGVVAVPPPVWNALKVLGVAALVGALVLLWRRRYRRTRR